MLQRTAVFVALLLLLALVPAQAEEPERWERFEAVPAWVTEPPASESAIRAVDVGLSNLLDLAYDPARVDRERLNLYAAIERRLRRLLGEGAREPALAGARAATVVRKGYHHHDIGGGRTVGGSVYAAFVLWETPIDAVLMAVPEAQREAALVLLRARLPAVAWQEVDGEPTWVQAPPSRDGMFVAVAEERSSRADVARATADLRGHSHTRFEIGARLRFHVGNDLASEAADEAVPHGTVVRRAWTASPARAWMLWEVPVERILAPLPAASRDAAARALTRPIPPRPWTWVAVAAEPAWVDAPPRWPDHLPFVQAVDGELAAVVKKQATRGAESEIREELERLLQPIVGFDAAAQAARAGASARRQGAHAVFERIEELGRASAPVATKVTVWALWQIPVPKILEALDTEHHAAVREALLP